MWRFARWHPAISSLRVAVLKETQPKLPCSMSAWEHVLHKYYWRREKIMNKSKKPCSNGRKRKNKRCEDVSSRILGSWSQGHSEPFPRFLQKSSHLIHKFMMWGLLLPILQIRKLRHPEAKLLPMAIQVVGRLGLTHHHHWLEACYEPDHVCYMQYPFCSS